MRLQQLVTVVGAHAEGKVGSVITGGVLAPLASSMFECQQKIIAEQDWLRGMLLSDPRGSVNAAVNLITPPVAPDADLGMIVIRSEEHTSELQSLMRISYAVFCLKKKNNTTRAKNTEQQRNTSIKLTQTETY